MLIINGRIYTMSEKNPVIDCGYLRTDGTKIIETGTMDNLPEKLLRTYQKNATESKNTTAPSLIDAKGAWVLPGLIEAHCHIGITEEKRGLIADDCNEQTNPSTASLRAIDAVNPMDSAFHDAICAGITTVMTGPGSANVIGGQFVLMKTQGRCIDQMAILSPAAMKTALGENPKTTYGDQGIFPSTRMGSAALLRRTLSNARAYYNQKKNHSLTDTDFSLEPWIPVLEKIIPMKVHAHRADDIQTAIRIAREFDISITIDHGTEGHLIADLIKDSGFPVIVGTGLTSRSKLEVQYLDFKTAGILQKAGVTIAITTDHPVSLIQYLPLCAGLAVKAGLPMLEGLRAITSNPAAICRAENRIGTLEPGKDADIAIFSGNPMETFTKTLYTIIDGTIVYQSSAK